MKKITTLYIGTVDKEGIKKPAAVLKISGFLFLAIEGEEVRPLDFDAHDGGARKTMHGLFIRYMCGHVDKYDRLQLPSDIFNKDIQDELGLDMANFLTGYFEKDLAAADDATRKNFNF